MGTVCCVEDSGTDSVGTSKIDMDEREAASPVNGSSDMLQQLKGHWMRKEDKMSLGAIAGNSMVWEAAYKHKPSPLWEVSGNKIKMSLGGEEHTGTVLLKQSEITWEDGEVWVRK
ncbi:unnamed protein product [Cladocopium goreaui]|uniref:Uncharacterized protein n=1 Tax=Cladocopium goreaui TaxID=2562237 RepID=A0A9P1CFZ5_9DINO|nr:unnamed protein product [Cladocopium goreaui]